MRLQKSAMLASVSFLLITSIVIARQVAADIPPATVTVDSTYPGYTSAVLTDGKWYEKGSENPNEWGPDRLGNGGNTWVSTEGSVDHWICLEWSEPVLLDKVIVWWSLAEWYSRAFRLEHLQDGQWTPVRFGEGCEGWLAANDRQTIIPLTSVRTKAIRLLQPARGGGSRAMLAAQEIIPLHCGDVSTDLVGARRLSPEAYSRLGSSPLARNIARLSDECTGASFPLVWSAKEKEQPIPALADGDLHAKATDLTRGISAGIRWPVEHSIEGVAATFGETLTQQPSLAVEFHDGRRWTPVRFRLKSHTDFPQRRLEWSFEPLATKAVRIRTPENEDSFALAEIEVYRNLPESKTIWPERFTAPDGLKQEILALPEEPSFEVLSSCALSMRTARALLGLKDTRREVGIVLDGTVDGRSRIEFRIGSEQYRLSEFQDALERVLIDGWRPGVEIRCTFKELEVRQTAFVAPMKEEGSSGALIIHFEIANLSKQPIRTFIEAEISSEQDAPASFVGDALIRDGKAALISTKNSRVGEAANTMCVDLDIVPGRSQNVLFIEPQDPVDINADVEPYRSLCFDKALGAFRRYWDDCVSTTTSFEVPEPQINRTIKAVIAQCFINGDGNVMPYGSWPSVYEDALFGIEESYPMLALAMFGFGGDAQRYMDGTYLTSDFLRKVDNYETVDDRHQQYRNGLQPHYAASLYRLSGDDCWIRKHLPLLKACAEWTISERRKTMLLEDGQKPLHWGLLPKWSYGGDIFAVQCYALYANLCCWRGLVDTAWLLDKLGDTETSKRYYDEAQDYRAAIDCAIEGNYQADQQPPFLPLSLYATKPDEEMDYYQLFAGCLLDIEPFTSDSKHLRWITDYLEESNRTLCFLPRFRHLGSGVLDALYGKGYFLTLLHSDSIREFLLAFYAYLAFNMEREVFTSRETNILYTSDLHARSTYGAAEISEPLPCGSAVALHLIRHALVTEERGHSGTYSGNLLLLAGAPRAWFAAGETIRIRNAPTYSGTVDVEVTSRTDRGRIEALIKPPKRSPCGTIRLRLRHPEGKPIRSVTINGKPHDNFDREGEWIILPKNAKDDLKIVASYH